MYPVIYWCKIYDDVHMKMLSVSGCTLAKSFTDAMYNIEAYYGEELCEIQMEMLEANSVIEFKTYEEAKKIVSDV